MSVLDIEKFARLAHSHGVPLIVDNTFATPVNCQPIKWGADIVTHSTTKYMDGHGVSVGGAIVDSGNFDWLKYADKYPGLTTPDDSYHGIVYAEKFGKLGYITKATSQLMRDLGSIQSPQNAFYVMNGLESLHVRMERHCKNALEIARFLKANDKVAWVDYPDLEDDKYHALAEKYLPNGSCGVLSFAVKGGRDCAVKFMDSLKLCDIETHVADAKTCILHPASHTHRQMTDEQLLEAGVHFGHQTRRWNPKMAEYIFTERNGIYIIDLQKSVKKLEEAYNFVRELSAEGKSVLFVGTKKQAQDSVKEEAERAGAYYVNARWLGGMLTNFATIRRRIARLKQLRAMQEDGTFDLLPKKEVIKLNLEIEKLEKFMGGIKDMTEMPGALFIVDPRKERIAVSEAKKLNIPIVAIVDTNCDPDEIDYVIPGNDDAIRAVKLIAGAMANAIIEGREGQMGAAAVEEEETAE